MAHGLWWEKCEGDMVEESDGLVEWSELGIGE